MQPPRTKGKQYIPLGFITSQEKIVNKCKVKILNNKLYVDDREINSFLLNNNFVIIKAQSFMSRERAAEVRTLRIFTPRETDNYAYFIEDGFYSLSQEEIRHVSGAYSAEVKFEVRFNVELSRVWIKIEKQHPVKFAIESGLSSDEIMEISLEKLPRSY